MTTTRVSGRIMLSERDVWVDHCCDCGRPYADEIVAEIFSDNPKEEFCAVCEEFCQSGWDGIFANGYAHVHSGDEGLWRWLVDEGLYLGQTFVAEVSVYWSRDYYGECDCDIEHTIVERGPVTQSMINRTCLFIQAKAREVAEIHDRKAARELSDEIVMYRWKAKGRIKKPITLEEAKKKARDREWSRRNGY